MDLQQSLPRGDDSYQPHSLALCPYSPASPCSNPRSPASGSESPRTSHDGWSKSGSAPQTPSSSPHSRQNQVSHVMLHGVMIVSLNIDGKERLCLAQISNTLLKDYSYNEIHNRRVALGITCVQCTPVQLEILRRAGAMPVSSRRCGMITKREAERLVKSFLEDAEPPKLPDDFAFQVYHECGWGCHGYFEPARYNSSRAKCIKCGYCNVYFSPNKFIFHFHRTPDAKYHHPDAANFNSWRRHLKLMASGNDDEMHVWEDVKAMFNGGTRKRIFSTSPRTSSSHSSSSSGMPRPDTSATTEAKKKTPKLTHSGDMQVTPKHPFPTPTFHPYPWGYGAGAKPSYPFVSVNTSQSLCFGFPPPPPGGPKDSVVSDGGSGLLKGGVGPMPNPWLGRAPLPFTNLADAFWDKAFGLPRPLGAAGPFRPGMYPPPPPPSLLAKASAVGVSGGVMVGGPGGGVGPLADSHSNDGRAEDDADGRRGGVARRDSSSLDLARDVQDRTSVHKGDHSSNNSRGNDKNTHHSGAVAHNSDRFSAFRLVGKNSTGGSDNNVNNNNNSSSINNNNKVYDGDDDDDDDDDHSGSDVDDGDMDETEEIDVMEEDYSSPQDLSLPAEVREMAQESRTELAGDRKEEEEREANTERGEAVVRSSAGLFEPELQEPSAKRRRLSADDVTQEHAIQESCENQQSGGEEGEQEDPQQENEAGERGTDDSGLSDESDADGGNADVLYMSMSKEELCHTLRRELCSRKKKEREVSVLKETFHEEVTREKVFRDQMARQLEILRETLTTELEQERKARYSLQQKLKEAHDALHSFSCSMLTAARDCGIKETPVVPR